MAVRAMIDAPDLYKVAAAHAGPADFIDHSTYIEPFLGLPTRNPSAYEAGSNLARVGAILGPVLVMAGPLDVNAGFTPSMKLVDAMITAKKDVDLVILPESNHRLNCCGRDREMYAVAVIQRYFRRYLQNERELP
jgi:dipeptidyl aminopeptidase/acylaminoacyl peptidase